jgi:glycosyltransferase involved in cell wall biosynthesis
VSGLAVALVPAYNEEHYVVSVLVRLMEYIERVIVCDDGSVDLMGEMAEALDAVGVGMIRVRRV